MSPTVNHCSPKPCNRGYLLIISLLAFAFGLNIRCDTDSDFIQLYLLSESNQIIRVKLKRFLINLTCSLV